MDIKARQTENTPAAWDAGEMVFVRRTDGTAAMYVTSASGVPHAVTGGDSSAALYVDGTGSALTLYREVPDTPATALARSGTPVSVNAVPDNVLNVSMFFRVLAATPITGLQIGGLTLSNGPVQAFITQHASDAGRTFQGQVAESAALTPQGGGHHATFASLTLHPNTLYGLRLGNSQSGIAPQVQLASIATYTGQGWSGLVLDPYLRWYANGGAMGEATYATAAATPAFDVLFEVPTVATPDAALITVRAGDGLTGTVSGAEITLTPDLDLTRWGQGAEAVTRSWAAGTNSTVSGQPGYRFRYTTNAAILISGLTVTLPAGRTLTLRVNGVAHAATTSGTGVAFNPPLSVPSGAALELDVDVAGSSYPAGAAIIPGATTTDGAVTYQSATRLDGSGAEVAGTGLLGLRMTILSGLPLVYGQLPGGAVAGLDAIVDRVTDLESQEVTAPVSSVAGRTGDVTLTSADLSDFTEAAQDAAAAMLADSTDLDGTYADGSNTYAFKVTGIQNRAVPAGGAAGQSIRLNPAGNAWEYYDPSATGGGGGGAALTRATTSVTTPSLADGTSADVLLPLGRTYLLHQLTASAACWARGHLTPEDRAADGSRGQAADPSPNAGVVFELIGTQARWGNPVSGWDAKTTPDGQVPVRVTNLSGATVALTLTATFITLEA
ncbi:hypothetical protein [Deinococcus sp. JMULE3]|uniref:hypothetical protein n=1 Tax=Deinococcus sp. JMULE3 TaxID=2518341 RepID=UPI001575C373|nr:hypothetical protein [Deinococcus sp. JMULE3]NTY02090.1 hypothetical protein [Deinococcus sp. JMULE3]